MGGLIGKAVGWVTGKSGIPEVIGQVGDILDGLITNKEELADAHLKLKVLELDALREYNRHVEAEASAEVEDRKSARQREVGVKGRNWVMNIIALSTQAAFFFMVGYILMHGLNLGGSTEEAFLIGTLLGMVASQAREISGYFFGSSRDARNLSESFKFKRP